MSRKSYRMPSAPMNGQRRCSLGSGAVWHKIRTCGCPGVRMFHRLMSGVVPGGWPAAFPVLWQPRVRLRLGGPRPVRHSCELQGLHCPRMGLQPSDRGSNPRSATRPGASHRRSSGRPPALNPPRSARARWGAPGSAGTRPGCPRRAGRARRTEGNATPARRGLGAARGPPGVGSPCGQSSIRSRGPPPPATIPAPRTAVQSPGPATDTLRGSSGPRPPPVGFGYSMSWCGLRVRVPGCAGVQVAWRSECLLVAASSLDSVRRHA